MKGMDGMGWDDQMRGLLTIDQIHVHPGEVGKGCSDEKDSNNWLGSRTGWRQVKGMEWDDQINQIVDQVYVHPGEEMGW